MTSQSRNLVQEDTPLAIMSMSSSQDLDSPVFGSLNENQDSSLERRVSSARRNCSFRGSRSSTPTSGTDYQSCSTDDASISEDGKPIIEEPLAASASEVVANVKMSANIADKLTKLRVSNENLDDISHSSFEEIEQPDSSSGILHQDSLTVGGSPSSSRRSSLKPCLRQVFPHISCLPFENNIVFCFVLSVWDNIVGPQTVYVWRRKSFPSQKTFDDLLDETEGVEMAEDGANLERSQLRGVSGQSDGVESGFGQEKSGHDQRKHGKTKPKRKTSISSQSSNPASCHNLKQDSNHVGTTSMPKRKDLHSNRVLKQSSVTSEKKSESSSMSNGPGECSSTQNDVQISETNCESFTTSQVSAHQGEESDMHNQQRRPSLGSFKTTSIDSTQLVDSDGQEAYGSWACGRSRLRMPMVVRYVTEHSVAVGQVGSASEKITSSLLVVPHQGIIIVAARFTVIEEDCAVPYCLSMVVPIEEYDYFLPLTQPVTTWLITIAASTRLLITKYGLEGGGLVKSKLVELCDVLVALRSASLDQYPLTPAGRPPDDRRLAEIILTSHLQTLGSTVVVADSPNAANKVIMWIAQFSDPADLHISRLCLSYTQWPFHPGLSIQGIVRSANGEVNLSAQKLIQSSRPLTVVDINRGTVKQTGAPDVHARRNSSALHQELLSLWHDLPDVSAPSESLLEPVRGAASLVKRFLQDYDRLSSCENSVRQNFIQAFLRSLKYTALAIITWTQQEWAVQRRRSGYTSLRRALCSVFDLDDCDLRILLAQAEALQPGFYTYVMM